MLQVGESAEVYDAVVSESLQGRLLEQQVTNLSVLVQKGDGINI